MGASALGRPGLEVVELRLHLISGAPLEVDDFVVGGLDDGVALIVEADRAEMTRNVESHVTVIPPAGPSRSTFPAPSFDLHPTAFSFLSHLAAKTAAKRLKNAHGAGQACLTDAQLVNTSATPRAECARGSAGVGGHHRLRQPG